MVRHQNALRSRRANRADSPLEALIGGNRDPRLLAHLAAGRAKRKTAELGEALRGFFTDHHAMLLRMMLDNDDRIGAQISALDAEIGSTGPPPPN